MPQLQIRGVWRQSTRLTLGEKANKHISLDVKPPITFPFVKRDQLAIWLTQKSL